MHWYSMYVGRLSSSSMTKYSYNKSLLSRYSLFALYIINYSYLVYCCQLENVLECDLTMTSSGSFPSRL